MHTEASCCVCAFQLVAMHTRHHTKPLAPVVAGQRRKAVLFQFQLFMYRKPEACYCLFHISYPLMLYRSRFQSFI